MAPKDWKEQERTITAAKAEILAALKKTDDKLDLGVQTVKSVQRGTASISYNANASGTVSVNITIHTVNPEKSVASLETSLFATYTNGSPYHVNSAFIGALEAERLTISRFVNSGSSSANNVQVGWQVIEFF